MAKVDQLPLIEERRKELLPQAMRYVRLPWTNSIGETIHDPLDLEVGPIPYLLQRFGSDASIKRKFRVLRDMRNALAHHRPVTVEQALCEELLG